MKGIIFILTNVFVYAYSIISCEIPAKANANITVTVTHPDSIVNGKKVLLEIDCIASKSSYIMQGIFAENNVTFEASVTGDNFDGYNSIAWITVYLIGEPENDDIDTLTYSGIPTVLAASNTQNIEYQGNIQSMLKQAFTLKEGGDQSLIIEFPKNLGIQVDYSNHPPVLSWVSYPNVSNEYEVAIIRNNENNNFNPIDNIGNTHWQTVFHDYASTNSIKVYSDGFRFKVGYGSHGIVFPPSVVQGDIFKIEVLVNNITKNQVGSFYSSFVDSKTIIYKE